MEHLLLPRGAVIASNERARYIAEPYDDGPFLTYPERSRFKPMYDVLHPEGSPSNYGAVLNQQEVQDLEIFLQTWLFFGLLHEVFGSTAPASCFITSSDNNETSLISTARLSDLADGWVKEHYDLEQNGKELLEHLLNCIWKTHQTISVVCDRTDVDRSIVWTISSVGETLEELILETLDKGTRVLPTTWRSYKTDALAKQMIDQGWCPSDVTKWRAYILGFQTPYYVSKIKQPKIKDHTRCIGEVCIANQYTIGKQPNFHRCVGGCCESFAVNVEAVKAVLQDGYIALLDITTNEEGLRIDVVSSKDHDTYVALSHVWVDGLGNPAGNKLPRCQLEYVGRVVKDMAREAGHGKILLWLDTLCCPVQSLPHRLLCITRMREIYQKATHVLVLDAALAHYNSNELDCVELISRLLFSAWTRRLWTLQEGALARSLWIQLKDKAVDVDAVGVELKQLYKTKLIYSPILTPICSMLSRIRSTVSLQKADKPSDLTQLRSAIQARSVSVATDEPLCLCTLLDLNQDRVVLAKDTDRMKVFWEVFAEAERYLQKNIIFFAGPRLTAPGSRWSPASFLSAVNFYSLRIPKSPDQLAKIVPQGLEVRFPAFQICVPEILPAVDRTQWNDIFKGLPSFCFVRQSEDSWFQLFLVALPQNAKDLILMDIILRNHGQNVILLESELTSMSRDRGTTDTCSALVVSVPEDASDRLLVHAEETISMLKVSAQQAMVFEAAWRQSQDPFLQASIRPFKKDADEEPVRLDDVALSRLPNAAVLRLQALAAVALADDTLAQCFQGTIEKRRDGFIGQMCLFLAGWFARVEHTWDASQVWYID